MTKANEHFWWTTLIRGFVALVAGSAVLVLPEMARTLLLLPFAMAISILGLAVYGIIDSVLVFVSSYMMVPGTSRIALRMQGVVGALVGSLMYWVFFDRVRLHWFLVLIALQSLSTAVAEFIVGRHSTTHATSYWNLTAAGVALVFSGVYLYVVLALQEQMDPEQITWLIYGYLVAFGIAQCLTASRMIYAGHHRVGPPDTKSASPQGA